MSRRSSSRLSMHNDQQFDIGEKVFTIDGRPGTVRYVGSAEFAPGTWIGIELDEPLGKNNGTINDVQYFDCNQDHGVFVRSSQISQVPNQSSGNRKMSHQPSVETSQFLPETVKDESDIKTRKRSKQIDVEPAEPVRRSSRLSKLKDFKTTVDVIEAFKQNSQPLKELNPIAEVEVVQPKRKTSTKPVEIVEKPLPVKTIPVDIKLNTANIRSRSPTQSQAELSAKPFETPPTVEVMDEPLPAKTKPVDSHLAQPSRRRSSAQSDTLLADELSAFAKNSREAEMNSATSSRRSSAIPSSGRQSVDSRYIRSSIVASRVSSTDTSSDGQSRRLSAGKKKSDSGSSFAGVVLQAMNKESLKPEGDLLFQTILEENGEESESPKKSTIPRLVDQNSTPAIDRTAEEHSKRSASNPFVRVKSPSRISIVSDNVITRSQELKSPVRPLDTYEITQALQEKLKLKFASRKSFNPESRDEILSLNEVINNSERTDALVSAYSHLFSKFEGLKIENANLFQQIDKLKNEKIQMVKKMDDLQFQLDEKIDLHESAIIDKCIAEESVDLLKERIKSLEDKVEELTLELDIGTKENADEEGINQLKHQNERYKEALIKLRDMSQQTELDLREKLKCKDQELEICQKVQTEALQLTDTLEEAKSKIQYLKEQLEIEEESSDIIYALTESNLKLDDFLMKAETEKAELESLRKINNELERAHTELEAKLYQELGILYSKKDKKDQVVIQLATRYQDLQALFEQKERALQEMRKHSTEKENTGNSIEQHAGLLAQYKECCSRLEDIELQLELSKLIANTKEAQLDIVKKYMDSTGLLSEFSAINTAKSVEMILDIIKTYVDKFLSHAENNMDPALVRSMVEIYVSFSLDWSVIQCHQHNDLTVDEIMRLSHKVNLLLPLFKEAHLNKLRPQQLEELLPAMTPSTISKCEPDAELSERLCFAITATRKCISAELTKLDGILEGFTLISNSREQFNSSVHSKLNTLENLLDLVRLKICDLKKRSLSLSSDCLCSLITIEEELSKCLTELIELSTQIQLIVKTQSKVDLTQQQADSLKALLDPIRITQALTQSDVRLKDIAASDIHFSSQQEPLTIWEERSDFARKNQSEVLKLKEDLKNFESLTHDQKQALKLKEDLLGQYEVRIAMLERKREQLDKANQDISNLQEDLRQVKVEIENYEKALEAVHADLTECEAENETLRRNCEILKQSKSSPTKRAVVQQAETLAMSSNFQDSLVSQRACIKYLYSEINRLRALKYSSIAYELFHPSDPLTKRECQKNRPSAKDNVKFARKLIEMGSKPMVVDLDALEDGLNWKPMKLDPVRQLILRRKSIQDLLQVSNDEFDKVAHRQIFEGKRERLEKFGRVIIPQPGETRSVKLGTPGDFDVIHNQFIRL